MRRTTQVDQNEDNWRENFKAVSLKIGFMLHLTRPQLEMLCATAADVQWDRDKFSFIGLPANWPSTESALERKGLLRRKADLRIASYRSGASDIAKKEAIRRHDESRKKHEAKFGVENSMYELTPAGKLVVRLVIMAGIFVDAEDGIVKKAKGG